MTREKYESLSLAALKDLAKARNIKGISLMKKSEIVDAMLALDAKEAAAKSGKGPGSETEEKPKKILSEEDRRTAVGEESELSEEKRMLDSGEEARGILEVMADGYGFIRSENYLPGDDDVYVAPSQIRRFGLKTGDIVVGNMRVKNPTDKFGALLYVKAINGLPPAEACKRKSFEDLTPIFPDEKLRLETPGGSIAMRIMDLMCPVGVFFPDGFSSFSSFAVLVDTRLIRPEVSLPRSTAPKSEVSMPRFKPPAEAPPEEEFPELLEEEFPPPSEPSNIGAAALRMLDVALWLTPLACATCWVVVWFPFARSMGRADVRTLVTSFFEAFVFLLTCFTVSSVIRPDNKAEISIYHRLLFQVRIYLPSLSPECPKKSINFALFH